MSTTNQPASIYYTILKSQMKIDQNLMSSESFLLSNQIDADNFFVSESMNLKHNNGHVRLNFDSVPSVNLTQLLAKDFVQAASSNDKLASELSLLQLISHLSVANRQFFKAKNKEPSSTAVFDPKKLSQRAYMTKQSLESYPDLVLQACVKWLEEEYQAMTNYQASIQTDYHSVYSHMNYIRAGELKNVDSKTFFNFQKDKQFILKGTTPRYDNFFSCDRGDNLLFQQTAQDVKKEQLLSTIAYGQEDQFVFSGTKQYLLSIKQALNNQKIDDSCYIFDAYRSGFDPSQPLFKKLKFFNQKAGTFKFTSHDSLWAQLRGVTIQRALNKMIRNGYMGKHELRFERSMNYEAATLNDLKDILNNLRDYSNPMEAFNNAWLKADCEQIAQTNPFERISKILIVQAIVQSQEEFQHRNIWSEVVRELYNIAFEEQYGQIDRHFDQQSVLRAIAHVFIWFYIEKKIDDSVMELYNDVITKYIRSLISSKTLLDSIEQPLVIFYSALLIGEVARLHLLKDYLLTIKDRGQQDQATRHLVEVYETDHVNYILGKLVEAQSYDQTNREEVLKRDFYNDRDNLNFEHKLSPSFSSALDLILWMFNQKNFVGALESLSELAKKMLLEREIGNVHYMINSYFHIQIKQLSSTLPIHSIGNVQAIQVMPVEEQTILAYLAELQRILKLADLMKDIFKDDGVAFFDPSRRLDPTYVSAIESILVDKIRDSEVLIDDGQYFKSVVMRENNVRAQMISKVNHLYAFKVFESLFRTYKYFKKDQKLKDFGELVKTEFIGAFSYLTRDETLKVYAMAMDHMLHDKNVMAELLE